MNHRTRTKPAYVGLIVAALLGTTAQAGADGASTSSGELRLRTSIMVDDDVVRLGDLFMEPLSVGDTPVAQAPAPGQTISFDARFLSQLARAYRLDWQPDSKFERVLVGRVSQKVSVGTVMEALGSAIHERFGSDAQMDIVLDGGDVEFVLPAEIPGTVRVQGLQYDPTSQRFSAVLMVPAEGPTIVQRRVSGTVYEMTEIPVLNHSVGAGTAVQEGDLRWISMRTDRLIGNVVTDADQIIGMTSKRPLRTGQLLRASDLVMTPTVRKNSLVTLSLQSGPMQLSVTGKALEDAAIGQTIRVVNVNSRKEVVGIVRDGHTVVVPLAGQLVLN